MTITAKRFYQGRPVGTIDPTEAISASAPVKIVKEITATNIAKGWQPQFNQNAGSPSVGPTSGKVYMCDYMNQRILCYDPSTGYMRTLCGLDQTKGEGSLALTMPGGLTTFPVPYGLAIDPSETYLYVSLDNSGTAQIWKIDLATGVCTSIGNYGTSFHMVISSNGQWLYHVVEAGHRVFKVELTAGYPSTVLGGVHATTGDADGAVGTSKFYYPRGLALNAAENILYVADYNNNKIRAIDLATNTTSTISGPAAGTTTAAFTDGRTVVARYNGPSSVALKDGILYIADASNSALRALDLDTGLVTTVVSARAGVGSADPGFRDGPGILGARISNPQGLVVAGGGLLISDYGNRAIRRYDFATGLVTTVGGMPTYTAETSTAQSFSVCDGWWGGAQPDYLTVWVVPTGETRADKHLVINGAAVSPSATESFDFSALTLNANDTVYVQSAHGNLNVTINGGTVA